MEETEGIVLNGFDFRQTSRIVTFFTRHFGKITGLAKGACMMNSPFSNSLEPFSHDYILFYRSRSSNIHLLSKCEVKNFFFKIREDALKSALALYWAEIIKEMVEDKDENLFEFIISSLSYLNSEEEVSPLLISFFEINLLKLSGHGPILTYCADCKKKSHFTRFSSKFGGLLCSDCSVKDDCSVPISPQTVSLVQALQKLNIKNLNRLKVSDVLLDNLKEILHYYLFYSIGKRPKSLAFLEDFALRCKDT